MADFTKEWIEHLKTQISGRMTVVADKMDPQTFEASPIEEMDPIECPACHQTHRWNKRDARFERDPNE